MIQIQDDFVSQSQPTAIALADTPTRAIQPSDSSNPSITPTPVAAIDAVPDQNEKINQAVQATMQKVETNTKNNAAEIDRLLAELDELSKNLEGQVANQGQNEVKAVKNEVKTESSQTVQPVVPVTEPYPIHDQVKDEDIAEAGVKVEDQMTQEEEKFDFDAFLDDLEKKIDEESAKIKAAKSSEDVADEVQEDFRKNRSTSAILDDSEQETVSKAPLTPPVSEEQNSKTSDESEELRAQNIFEMLGLANISDEEKNQFLDELESMIWDDFVVHDLELLLTSEEYVKAREILDSASDETKKKEDLIVYLEGIVPDLDEVLYEKALELKSEMMGERLSKMKEGADEATLAKVKQAESLISRNLWRQAANLLNS